MFDPVPNFPKYNNAPAIFKTGDVEALNQFVGRVKSQAKHYRIKYDNRFAAIFTACAALNALLKEHGRNVWPAKDKEPLISFQNMFQLLIYAIADNGLLYDSFGGWIGYRRIDEEGDVFSGWKSSEEAYKQFAFAMRSRYYSYLRLKKLRSMLKSHADQFANSGNKTSDFPSPSSEWQPYLHMSLKPLYPNMNKSNIQSLVRNLCQDHLLMHYAPLYLFLATFSSDPSQYDAKAFLSDLNHPTEIFSSRMKESRLCKQSENCLRYRKIEQIITQNFSSAPLVSALAEFEPFRILMQIERKTGLTLTDEQRACIANEILLNYIKKPSIDVPNIVVNNTPIIDIMKAFFTVWQAQKIDFTQVNIMIPKNAKLSLRLLYQSGILDKLDEIPVDTAIYTNEQYNAIKTAVFNEYSAKDFASSQELFWLLSGYVPPHDFSFQDWENCPISRVLPQNLYELCDFFLWRLWKPFNVYLRLFSPSIRYSHELYQDILKARTFFARRWNHDMETQFIEIISSPISKLATELPEIIEEWYDSIKDHKTSFKSFGYASHEIYKALLYDCFRLTGSHLYEEVFSLLASLNKTLWPI